MHRIKASSRSSQVIFTYKTRHGTRARNGSPVYEEISKDGKTFYRWSNDNATYTELGGLAEGKKSYSVIFSTDRSPEGRVLDSSRAFRNCPDPRDLAMLCVKKKFGGGRGSIVPDSVMLGPIDPNSVEESGFYNFGGRWAEQRVTGVHWLTRYGPRESARSAHIIPLGKGRQRLVWEKHSPNAPVQLWTMVVDESAQILEKAQAIGSHTRWIARGRDDHLKLASLSSGRGSARPERPPPALLLRTPGLRKEREFRGQRPTPTPKASARRETDS